MMGNELLTRLTYMYALFHAVYFEHYVFEGRTLVLIAPALIGAYI